MLGIDEGFRLRDLSKVKAFVLVFSAHAEVGGVEGGMISRPQSACVFYGFMPGIDRIASMWCVNISRKKLEQE